LNVPDGRPPPPSGGRSTSLGQIVLCGLNVPRAQRREELSKIVHGDNKAEVATLTTLRAQQRIDGPIRRRCTNVRASDGFDERVGSEQGLSSEVAPER